RNALPFLVPGPDALFELLVLCVDGFRRHWQRVSIARPPSDFSRRRRPYPRTGSGSCTRVRRAAGAAALVAAAVVLVACGGQQTSDEASAARASASATGWATKTELLWLRRTGAWVADLVAADARVDDIAARV